MRLNVTELGIAVPRAIVIIAVFAALLGAGVSALGSERRVAVVDPSPLASDAGLSLQMVEVPFAVPIRLRTLRRSSVGAGPGTGYPVLFTLEAHTTITGHSYINGQSYLNGEYYAEDWVRVSDESGRSGWMLSALVARLETGER